MREEPGIAPILSAAILNPAGREAVGILYSLRRQISKIKKENNQGAVNAFLKAGGQELKELEASISLSKFNKIKEGYYTIWRKLVKSMSPFRSNTDHFLTIVNGCRDDSKRAQQIKDYMMDTDQTESNFGLGFRAYLWEKYFVGELFERNVETPEQEDKETKSSDEEESEIVLSDDDEENSDSTSPYEAKSNVTFSLYYTDLSPEENLSVGVAKGIHEKMSHTGNQNYCKTIRLDPGEYKFNFFKYSKNSQLNKLSEKEELEIKVEKNKNVVIFCYKRDKKIGKMPLYLAGNFIKDSWKDTDKPKTYLFHFGSINSFTYTFGREKNKNGFRFKFFAKNLLKDDEVKWIPDGGSGKNLRLR